MRIGLRWLAIAILACMLATACGMSPQTATGGARGTAAEAASGPKGTLRIAWAGEPPSLSPKMAAPGGTAFNELAVTFNSALTYWDPSGKAIPMIAREIPTLDNGGWVVNDDGTMVTTYHLRPAKWHDGAPLTAQDFAFAFTVYVNPQVPIYRRDPERYISSVEAPDESTVVINWARPYYRANALRYTQLDPLPAHILADVYARDLDAFVNGPYWTDKYVGSGPFKVDRWDPGVGLTAKAFNDWVLGPPKAAALDIRFMADANTILANLLSGDLDISAHPWFPPSLAAQLKESWGPAGTGSITVSESRMEHMDLRQNEVPGWQPAIVDPRVRQAILTAIDRGSVADLLNAGLAGSPADAFILRTDPIFPDVDRAIAKYPYDPARAERLLADVGWHRTGSGLLTDAAGATLGLEVSATAGPAGEQETAFIANNWKDVGIDATPHLRPRVLAADPELDATFPGGSISNRPVYPDNFSWTTAQIPTPETRIGQNRGHFSDADIDRYQDAVLTATSDQAFLQNSVALHKRMSEMLGTLPLFYPADVIVARSPITGPQGHFTYPCYSWNIFEWGFAS